jgi:hypothetical protein
VIGDAVVTGVGINPMTGFIAPTFTSNELYPAANNNAPLTREPEFGPTTQFIVSAGTSTIGDLVFVPILDAFPRFRARADVGEVVPLRFISSPTDAGKIVVGAAAFGRSPGILLPDMRIVPLNNDALLTFSTTPLNGVFLNFAGVLDVNGVFDGAAIFVPPIQALHGFVLYVAYVVLDPAAPLGIGTISLPSTFVVE